MQGKDVQIFCAIKFHKGQYKDAHKPETAKEGCNGTTFALSFYFNVILFY